METGVKWCPSRAVFGPELFNMFFKNSMSIDKYKPRSESSHISFSLTFQQVPSSISKARPWPLTSSLEWSRKPHCALTSRLDGSLQQISPRQVEGQVKWNLIDETVQETNLVHRVQHQDSWACCDSISSRIRATWDTVMYWANMPKSIRTPAQRVCSSPSRPAFLLSPVSEGLPALSQAPVNYAPWHSCSPRANQNLWEVRHASSGLFAVLSRWER